MAYTKRLGATTRLSQRQSRAPAVGRPGPFCRSGGCYEAAVGRDRGGGGHLVPERRLAAAARRGERRQRVPAGAALRRRARSRERLLRGLRSGESQLYDQAARGMLEELKDPYSVLLTGDDYKSLTEQTSGQLRRPRHPDRRARRLDHRRRAAAGNARRAGRRADGRPDHRSGRQIHRRVEERSGGEGAAWRRGQQDHDRRPPVRDCGADHLQPDSGADPYPVGAGRNAVRRRRRIHLAESRCRDLGRRAARGDHRG